MMAQSTKVKSNINRSKKTWQKVLLGFFFLIGSTVLQHNRNQFFERIALKM